jgi:hypothetical protein
MRWIVAVLALGLTACDASVGTHDKGGDSAAGGYTLEIRASQAEQTYLVTTPDGRTVGAHAAEGLSALLNTTRAQALAAEAPPQSDEGQEVMSLRVPGFEMNVSGSDEDADGDHGRVQLSVGGQQNVTINADEGGPGEADDRAHVRITGADEDAVRKFIADADELSPDVRTQMLAELHLD